MDIRFKAASEAPRQVAPRTFQAVASAELADRYGDVILVTGEFRGKRYGAGWQLGEFHANPVLLAFHNAKAPAVGAVEAWRDDAARRLMARVTFADTTLGRELAHLYSERVMRAFSVGFLPAHGKVYEPESDAERRAWGLGPGGLLFAEQALLELSAVNVPALPAALVESEAKGYARVADVLAAEGLREAAYEIRSALPSTTTALDLGAASDRAFAAMDGVMDMLREAAGLPDPDPFRHYENVLREAVAEEQHFDQAAAAGREMLRVTERAIKEQRRRRA